MTAVPPLATSTVSPSLALLANNLSMPTSDLPPGASPRKKPRKQQHVISTEEGDMMETNSTDDEKSTAKSLLVKAEKRKSPPKEYIGNGHLGCCHVTLSHLGRESVPEAVPQSDVTCGSLLEVTPCGFLTIYNTLLNVFLFFSSEQMKKV